MNNKITVTQHSQLDQGVDIILAFQKGKVDTALIESLSRIKDFTFSGDFKETDTIYTQQNRIFLVGLGEDKHLSNAQLAFQSLAFGNKSKWNESIQLYAENLTAEVLTDAISGIFLATYDIGIYKSSDKSGRWFDDSFQLHVVTNQNVNLNEGKFRAESVNSIRALVDTPSNDKTPEFLANWSKASASQYGYTCQVFEKDELIEKEVLLGSN